MKIFSALKTAKDIGGKAPDEFMIFKFGEIEIEDSKPVLFDKEAAKAVLSHFNTFNHDMVIDYEHQTLGENKAPAAGWCTDLTIRDDGLYAKVKWTDEAAGYLKAGEYRYFSPVFYYDKKSRRINKLYNLALTNQPRMKDIQALAAKLTVTQKQGEKLMLEKLRKLYNLKDDATEDEVLETCKAVTAEVETLTGKVKELEAAEKKPEQVACKTVLDALGLDEKADATKVCNTIAGFKAPATAAQELAKQVAELTTEMAEIKRDDLISIALKSGKTSPEEITAWGKDLAEKSPDQFKKIVLSRPEGSVIPLHDLTALKKPADKKGEVSESQAVINEALGITKEDFEKYAD